MITSTVTATAPSNASSADEPTVVIERQTVPSARPTLSRRERFHSSGDLFEISEAEGLDHVCLDRGDVLVGLVGTIRCANDRARTAATLGLTHELVVSLRDVIRNSRGLSLERR